jgi:hypothetical protein
MKLFPSSAVHQNLSFIHPVVSISLSDIFYAFAFHFSFIFYLIGKYPLPADIIGEKYEKGKEKKEENVKKKGEKGAN